MCILDTVLTGSTTPKNLCPAVCRCAIPISPLTVSLLYTMSSADYFCCRQNFKIHPFQLKNVFLFPTVKLHYIRCLSRSKGYFFAFFFNTAQTVFLFICKTLPVSRTQLPLSVNSIIFSFTPASHAYSDI
jgi:hypothetical protein